MVKHLAASVVLVFIILLNGCAFMGIEFGTHRTISVEKSPIRVVLSGDITHEDYVFAHDMVDVLSKLRYRDHNFTSVEIHVSGHHTTQHTNDYGGSNGVQEKQGQEE
jgi:hypothetical protein